MCLPDGRRRGVRCRCRAAAGISDAQRSKACGQRSRNGQPRLVRRRIAQRAADGQRRAVLIDTRHGNGGDERARIGMTRVGDDRGGRPLLDHAAEIHDERAFAHVADQREIMADIDRGEAELVARLAQQVEDARAHRDVEHRDRLVGDDQRADARSARARARHAATARRRARAGGDRARRRPARDARAASPPRCASHAPRAGCRNCCRGSRRVRPMEKRGLSASNGFWKTSCARLRKARRRPPCRWVMSCPSNTTCPEVGSSSRSSIRAVVVLPHPDSPTMPTASPGATARLTPRTARTVRRPARNVLTRSRAATIGAHAAHVAGSAARARSTGASSARQHATS